MDLARNLIGRINVGDSLTRTAAARPGQLAVVDGERRLTYAGFNACVNRLAHGLAGLGYQRGATLALASGNSADFLAVYYACAKLGVVCVPVNLGWQPDEVAYVLGHSQARGIVVESQLLAAMHDAVAKVPEVLDVIVAPGTATTGPPGSTGTAGSTGPPGTATTGPPGSTGTAGSTGTGIEPRELADRAWTTIEALTAHDRDAEPECFVDDRDALSYLYTSGTTSFPKGVVGSHLAIYLESMSVALDAGFRADDRFAAMMPMFHTAQLNGFGTPAVLVGATMYVLRGFESAALLDLIERERITQIFGLPIMYRAMLDHDSFTGRDLSSLRRATYAMAPMPDELIRRCLAGFGCDFALGFGQTEMSPVTTFFQPEHQLSHTGAVGTPMTGVQVAIMGPGGQLLPPRQAGEIVYRGPSTMSGYLHDEEATGKAFAHGWFHSGDVGWFGEDGMLWFTDRYKDVIKTGGENVASIEVEKAIYAADPRVAEVVVVGLPHPQWGEAVTAFVVPRPGDRIDPAGLIATLRTGLAGFKVPKAVVFTSELPKTSTGKVQKNVVRSEHAAHYTQG